MLSEASAGTRTQDQFARLLDEAAIKYRLYPPHVDYNEEIADVPIRDLRRARVSMRGDHGDLVTIADVRGVLRWRSGPWSPHIDGRSGDDLPTRIVRQYRLPALPDGEPDFLERVDHGLNNALADNTGMFYLTRQFGLERIRGGDVPQKGHFLLFVHGAFSSGGRIIAQLRNHPDGQAFLNDARRTYHTVLFFEHPTLSTGVLLNATELSHYFRRSSATVDVISHGRGGLVTRWWLEALETRETLLRRSVFIGCPLVGTAQNAPTGLHALLELLLNVGRFEVGAVTLVPWLEAALALIRIVTMGTGPSGAPRNWPRHLIPGLACQSNLSNREIEWLGGLFDRSGERFLERYFAVTSRTIPTDSSSRTCQYRGPNDLLVETGAMVRLSRKLAVRNDQQVAFEPADGVHHGNYFSNSKTFEFLRRVLLTTDAPR
jgi:hypothetical protein